MWYTPVRRGAEPSRNGRPAPPAGGPVETRWTGPGPAGEVGSVLPGMTWRELEEWQTRHFLDRERRATAAAWARWLSSIPFEWWVTLTFQYDVSITAADVTFARWQRAVLQGIYGRRFYRAPGASFWGVYARERTARGRIHFHALTNGGQPFAQTDADKQAARFAAMRAWEGLAGYARIFDYRPGGGADGYLTKYVVKGGVVRPFGPWPASGTAGMPRAESV